MTPDQWGVTLSELKGIDEKYENVLYINLLKGDEFNKSDFYDPDHLNERGSEKLMALLNERLVTLLKE